MRRTLKDLQSAATDKENLAGRPHIIKNLKLLSDAEKSQTKRKLMQNKSIQTGECTITAADLLSNEPSVDYWKCLAETRREALTESLKENETLKENIAALKEENRICKEMLEESKCLIELLQEMLQDHEENKEEDEKKKRTNEDKEDQKQDEEN